MAGHDHLILHTRQHYSYNMDKVFFEGLPEAKYNLDAGYAWGTDGEDACGDREGASGRKTGFCPDKDGYVHTINTFYLFKEKVLMV